MADRLSSLINSKLFYCPGPKIAINRNWGLNYSGMFINNCLWIIYSRIILAGSEETGIILLIIWLINKRRTWNTRDYCADIILINGVLFIRRLPWSARTHYSNKRLAPRRAAGHCKRTSKLKCQRRRLIITMFCAHNARRVLYPLVFYTYVYCERIASRRNGGA